VVQKPIPSGICAIVTARSSTERFLASLTVCSTAERLPVSASPSPGLWPDFPLAVAERDVAAALALMSAGEAARTERRTTQEQDNFMHE
jgi:hypothetical protein